MANYTIPQLNANTGLTGAVVFEDYNPGSSNSEQVSLTTLATWLSTNFASLSVGGGKFTVAATGALSASNGLFTVDASGNVVAEGSASFVAGEATISAGGAVAFAAGNFVVNAGGAPTKVSATATAGLGIPIIVASTSFLNDGESEGPTELLAGAPAGLYRISGYMEVMNPDTATIDITLSYTDENGAQTIDLSGTQSLASNASFPCGNNVFGTSNGQDITYSVTVTGGSASSNTQVFLVLERLQ